MRAVSTAGRGAAAPNGRFPEPAPSTIAAGTPKLYRTCKFFDYDRDPQEEKPLEVKTLDAEAAAARKKLQEALDQYKDARPAKYAPSKPDGKQAKR